MIRSYHDDNPEEFELIREPDHIANVSKKMKAEFAHYFDSLVAKAPAPTGHAIQGCCCPHGRRNGYIKKYFNAAVERFEKDRSPYVGLFQPAHMESYRENASTFRSRLVTKCPVIQKTIHSKREELHEWKRRFGSADSQELADIFANLIDFQSNYADSVDRRAYAKFDSIEEFEFSEVEDG